MASRAKCAVYYGMALKAQQSGLTDKLHDLLQKYELPRNDRMRERDLLGALLDAHGLTYVPASDARGDDIYLLSVEGHSTRVYEFKHVRLLDDLSDPTDADVAKLVSVVEGLADFIPEEDRTPAWRAYIWIG